MDRLEALRAERERLRAEGAWLRGELERLAGFERVLRAALRERQELRRELE